ncbi:MAG: hypothetical protein HLUCCO02_04740 [Idiomarinaceae bacterium HL-53]|nr:MAG: hypothetical protein HLUCCO02_04740 [Idiomarinaceae bacterium HL-53]CUS49324.1 hypothetical protein Ga0003345_2312 [Idiomarinaceae bacterium HL-53]
MVTTGLGKVLYCLGIFALSVASLGISIGNATEITLNGPSGKVSEGYFQLQFETTQFETETPGNVVIERAETQSFDSVVAHYAPMGDFQQLTLSGFSNGTYYFRARHAESNTVSNVVKVEVQHYSLVQAFTLFIFGGFIFALLVWVILRAHRQSGEVPRG